MTEDLLLNLPPGALSRVPFHPSQEIELAAARLIARADQIRAGIAAYPDGALLGAPVGGGGAAGITLPTSDLLLLIDPDAAYVYSDAGLTSPASDAGSIRGVQERGPSALQLKQSGVVTSCPTWYKRVAAFNDRPALNFGGDDYILSSLDQPILGNLTTYTIYFVYRNDGSGGNNQTPYCESKSDSTVQRVQAQINDGGTGTARPYHVDDAGTFTDILLSSSTNNSDNESRLLTVRRNGNEWELRINRWREKAQTKTIGTTTTDQFGLGARILSAIDRYFTGQIALFAAYASDNCAIVEPLIDAYFSISTDYWASVEKRFLAIGDSKTLCQNDPTRDRLGGFGWPPLLASGLTTASGSKWRETELQRIGISGYSVAAMASVIDARLAAINDTPDAVILGLGTNDLASLPAENTWKTNYRYILDAIHIKYPSALIYVSKPVRLSASPPSAPVAETATLHGWIDDLIAEQSYIHAGADETELEGGDGYVTNFADNLHPNHTGYTAYASLLKTALGY